MADFTPITTQEDFDAAVSECIENERKKYEGFEDLKEKAANYDKLKTDADGYQAQIADLSGKVKTYEANSVKLRIAHENNIPYELASKLTGENEEDIKKDAETMAKYLSGAKRTAPLAQADPETVNDKKAAMKKMLSGLKGE